MKIGIIGAGFTGLSAAYYLTRDNHDVTVFEKDPQPGGLAIGYQEKEWKWSLEKHYHHWFTNDKSVLELAREIHHPVIIKRPKTSSFVDGSIFQLDSPLSLLTFPKLSLIDRIRMGISLAILRYNPFWKPFEFFRAKPYLERAMGKAAYKKIWEPLMVNKLGKYANTVSLAWFWARVFKRTSSLAYPEGGFLQFALHLQKEIEKKRGKIHYSTEVIALTSKSNPEIKFKATNSEPKFQKFDTVIVTLPSVFFTKIASDLPTSYTKNLGKLKGIGAMNMIIRMKKPFLKDASYWLNMCDTKSPILAIVEHTNFMDKSHYNNEHIVYVGNYMETTDPRFLQNEKELFSLYEPWLKKMNPDFKKSVIDYKVFKAPFAQPIIPPKYSGSIPAFLTPLKNVYLANIEQVYPWDRGTNYAVELGKKIAEIATRSS